ncbi:alternative ribosome rescue aminoacyl-tRNA hydrolase ArfB [Maribacter sp. 2-571]|uniref:alternative ribosome rescue aminoacyl-tRNA hydrolase ArfB n=1 Tax=Maribacter sp. 2-571 TaxID=3417569 RepID=UPI003D33E3F6
MNREQLLSELEFKAARSSGAGGQHVNKVATKILLLFSVANSLALSESEKAMLLEKLSQRVNKEGNLILQCDETRSQFRNKALAIARFLALVDTSLCPVKKRKKTRPSKAADRKRLEAKKKKSQKKASRGKIDLDRG